MYDAASVAEYIHEIISARPITYAQEEMWALLLNAREQITHEVLVSRGALDGTLALPGMIFRDAIRLGAGSGIVTHNHPSGDPTQSHADVLCAQHQQRAGQLLNIFLMYHVIVAHDSWYSMREHGLCASSTRP